MFDHFVKLALKGLRIVEEKKMKKMIMEICVIGISNQHFIRGSYNTDIYIYIHFLKK